MGKHSTRFIKFHEIYVDKTDLYEDAMGFTSDFHDVFGLLNMVSFAPGKRLNSRLIKSIRHETGNL